MSKAGWRFIDLGCVDSFYGPAAFEAVMDARAKDLVSDTILFWRPQKPSVYVGYHQFVHEDINVAACKVADIPIIRRILGGGTGYCDRGQILYNVIFKEGAGFPCGPKGVYCLVLGGVISALKSLGIMDSCIDENRFSVYANGKKISGSGQLSSGGVVNSGGSFLVDFNYLEMSKYLIDPVKNLRIGVKTPEEGLTCLRREIGEISVETAGKALRAGFEEVLGPAKACSLSGYESKAADGLRDKYLSSEWTFRADMRKDKKKNSAIIH